MMRYGPPGSLLHVQQQEAPNKVQRRGRPGKLRCSDLSALAAALFQLDQRNHIRQVNALAICFDFG